jgi:hypothetical protein
MSKNYLNHFVIFSENYPSLRSGTLIILTKLSYCFSCGTTALGIPWFDYYSD